MLFLTPNQWCQSTEGKMSYKACTQKETTVTTILPFALSEHVAGFDQHVF